MQRIALFLSGVVFLTSCGSESTPNSQNSDSSGGTGIVDLDIENADQHATSIPVGTPTTLTSEYYDEYWNEEDWTSGPGTTPSYTVYNQAIHDNATTDFILKYLTLDAGDGNITWIVKNISGTTHTLFEVDGTSGEMDRLVMISGQTLDSNSPEFYECNSSGTIRYCDATDCDATDGETCYDSTGTLDGSFSGSSTGKAFHFAEIEADGETLTNGKLWMELISEDAEEVSSLDGDSVRFDPDNLTAGSNSTSYIRINPDNDADADNGLGGNNDLELSSSLLVRMYNCYSAEDSILLDGTTSMNLSGSDVLDDATDAGDYSTATGTETIDLFGDSTTGDYCEYYFYFDAEADDNDVKDTLRALSYNNSVGASATEGDRIVKIFARYGNGRSDKQGGVSQPVTVTVGVWNDPVLTEVTAIGTTNEDPVIVLSADKAGTLAIGDDGVASDCGNISISPTSISADTNTAITLTHGTSWTDATTYEGCQITLTETETGFSTTHILDITDFTLSLTAVNMTVTANGAVLGSGSTTNDDTLELAGTSPASVNIGIDHDNDATDDQTTTADGNGDWTATTPALSDGTYNIVVTDTDNATTHSGTNPFVVTIDTTAPAAPTIVVADDQGTITTNVTDGGSTDDTVLALSGTMESGATIDISGVDLAAAITYGTATTWSVDTDTLVDGTTYNLSITATDAAGNVSAAETFDVTIDTTAPAAPSITSVTDGEGTITGTLTSGDSTDDTTLAFVGTSESGATISVDHNNNATEDQNTTATGINWSFTTTALSNGTTYPITITAVDAAGNESSAVTFNVTIDTTAPAAPTIVVADDQGTVTGNLTDGADTDDTVLALSGTMETSATIDISGVTLDGPVTYPTTTTWAATTDTLTEATHTISVTATDAAGNVSTAETFEVTVDRTAPNDPVITSVTDDATPSTGTLNSGNSTNDTELAFVGTSESGATISIDLDNDATEDQNTTATGVNWSFTTNTLSNGTTYPITITAIDAAGNESAAATFNVTIDTSAPTQPTLVITDDNAGSTTTFTGDLVAGTETHTDDTILALSGVMDSGETVDITGVTLDGAITYPTATTWSATTDTLAEGAYTISVDSTDAAGNESSASSYSITVDTTAPAVPSITSVTDDVGTTVTLTSGDSTNDTELAFVGTSESGATISIDLENDATEDQNTTATGVNWSFTTNTLSDATTYAITLTAIDAAGNESSAATFNVTIDTSVPTAPTLVATDDEAGSTTTFTGDLVAGSETHTDDTVLALSGTMEANATIDITGVTLDGAVTYPTSTTWSVDTVALTDGTTYNLSVTATDGVGNESSATTYDIIVDTTAPTAPTLVATDDEAGSNTTFTGDLVAGSKTHTDDTVLALSGVMEASATIDISGVTLDGVVTYPTSTTWAATTITLTNGTTYNLSINATDLAGNTSTNTTFDIIVDTTAPNAPTLVVTDDEAGSNTTFTGDLVAGSETHTDDTVLVLSGTMEANAIIDVSGVTLSGVVTYPTTTTWSATTASLTDATYNLSITATDAADNESSAETFDIIVDTGVAAPVLSSVADDAGTVQGNLTDGDETDDTVLVLTGTAEADSTLIFTGINLDIADAGVNGDGTVTVDNSGNWSAPTETLIDGTTYNISFTATDLAGNISTPTTFDVTIDTTAPNAPTLVVTDNQDGGTNNTFQGDLVAGSETHTDDIKLALSGAAEADSSISIDLDNDGNEDLNATATGGAWSVSTGDLAEGTYNISVTATDASGNESSATTFDIIVDTTAPTSLTLTATDNVGINTGSLTDGQRTDDTVLVLSGDMEAAATVDISGITIDGSGITYPTSSTWTATTIGLTNDTTYNLSITETDLAGNISTATEFDVLVDTSTETTLVVTDDVTVHTGDLTDGSYSNDSELDLSGTATNADASADEGATVVITATLDGNAETIVSSNATTDASGDWDITTNTLTDGTYVITSTVTDVAGNSNTATFTVISDLIDPVEPSLVITDDETGGANATFTGDLVSNTETHTDDAVLVLSGTAEADSLIYIDLDNDSTPDLSTTAPGGSWTATTATLTEGTYNISVTSEDAAGNTSTAATYDIIVDTTAPAAPVITGIADSSDAADFVSVTGHDINAAALEVYGTAENFSTLEISGHTIVTASITSDTGSTPNWTGTTDSVTEGVTYTFTAVATDRAGNRSATSTAFDITIDLSATAPVFSVKETDASGADLYSSAAGIAGGVITHDSTGIMGTTATELHFSGTAEAGGAFPTVIDVDADTSNVASVQENGAGDWTGTTSTLADGQYIIDVMTTDDAGNEANATAFEIIIDTTGPNLGPSASQLNIDEMSVSGTTVGTIEATDDGIEGITYAETGGSGLTYFVVDSISGEITFIPDASEELDHETNDVLSYEITATDELGNSEAQSVRTFFIQINDLNDSPVVDLDGSSNPQDYAFPTINENANKSAEKTASNIINGMSTIPVDPDVDTMGIVIYAVSSTGPGAGSWFYNLDNAGWTELTDLTNALFLDNNDKLRFEPDGDNGETTTLSFYVWDQIDSNTITSVDLQDVNNRGGETSFSLNEMTTTIEVTDVNDDPVFTATVSDGSYVEDVATVDLSGAVIEDVDFSEALTVTVTLGGISWPDDTNAPNGSGYDFDQDGDASNDSVRESYPGTLATDNFAWDGTNNQLVITGSVTEVNAELATLLLTPITNLDFDFSVTITVEDDDLASASDPVSYTCSSRSDDPPVAMLYTGVYEDISEAQGGDPNDLSELSGANLTDAYIRLDGRESWDPDLNDEVVTYVFYPSRAVNTIELRDGENASSGVAATIGGTGYETTEPVIVYKADLVDFVSWRLEVKDTDDTSNVPAADEYDEAGIAAANTAPYAAIFPADTNCSRTHAEAAQHPTYIDEEADCFCDTINGNELCLDAAGDSCNPTKFSGQLIEVPAVFESVSASGGACYCDRPVCDGTDGAPICYNSGGSNCTPATTYCTPVPSPNDYSYPFDHNIEMKVCAYDVDDGDVLSYSWEAQNIIGQAPQEIVLRNGETLQTSPLDSDIVHATVRSTGPSGFGGFAEFDLNVTVSDGEDDTVITMRTNACLGRYEDDDNDFYVNEDSFYANCTTSDFDVVLDPTIAYIQQDDPAKLGWDCLDSGDSIIDTGYGDEASLTTLAPGDVQDTINWYIDTDGDGYGSFGNGVDDSDGNNILDTSESDNDPATDIEVAYGGENVVGNCVIEKPSSNGYDYVLNNDDCNDSQDIEFTYTNLEARTQVTRSLTPDFQSPETVWQLDADEDGFASNYVWDASESDIDYDLLYFSEDYTCLCDAGCGSCAKPRVQTNSTTSAEACATTPAACITYKSIYNSCENPAGLTIEGDAIDASSTWIIGQGGDCNESATNQNPTAQEECDPNNDDEDCNGLSDDDDTNVNGAYAYYGDNDSDGYPNENLKSESCDGGSTLGYNFVQAYDLSNAVETDVSGNVLLTDSQDPTSTIGVTDCTCATDTCGYACVASSSTGSNITYCAANPDQSTISTCVIGDPYDPQDTQYDSFQVYVFDCDDTRAGVYPTQTEFCDGVLNDCTSGSSIPTDEVDYDNDSYVECDYQGGWLGGSSTEPNIGSDCSSRDPNVYPNAPSICDGQYNNCASWLEKYVDEDGDCYCSGQNGDGSCADNYCVDETGDVCVPTDLDNDTIAACATVGGEWMSPGAPTNQVDNDGDCYVECYDGSTTWMGDLAVLGGDCLNLLEGQDCNDASSQVYPGAPEVCDGQYNDCDAASYDPTSAPSNETDDDLDSYVDCAEGEYLDRNGCVCFDSDYSGTIDGDELNECEAIGGACIPDEPTLALVTWVSQPGPGYSDCDDLDATRYPGANEICDGQFNDCYHELLDPFEGVAGNDCYCLDENGTNCVNAAGDVCTPEGDLVQLTTAETVNALDYDYQEVECYCTNTFCEIDIDGDNLSDCLDENSDPCDPTDNDQDGFADTCIADPIDIDTTAAVSRLEYLFNDVTNSYPEAPGRELDNDGDTYIECNIGGNAWLGSPNVVAGGDCDDYLVLVKPAGAEYCDGQYNDCDALTYDEFGAPADETDNDLDGYVECELTLGVPWERSDTEPTGYGDCDDTDNVIYPTAPELCDGVYNNCSNGNYDAASAPEDELDGDEDGYVECSDAGDVWKGAAITGYDDCDPVNVATYPGATDICDAQFNDCEHPMRDDSANAGAYEGVVGDCFCAITTDGSGDDVCDASDCVDVTGAACTPEDADADGYVDNCEIADAGSSASDFTPAGSTYYGVEVDCYCPTTTCQSNVSGNSSSECYTPDGTTCSMPFNSSGIFTDCATNAVDTDLTVSHIFYDENGDQQAQPFEEFDNDGDRYVECTQFDLDAYQQAGGSLLVIGGSDCDDADGRVYPAAPEYCDGQYNDCDALTYNASLAPTDETDNDLDGYVECELTIGVDWDNPDTEPTGYGDCDDTDNVIYPTAPELCDGIYNDCSNGNYEAASAPEDELDGDADGYVECSDAGDVWKGAAITGYDDCDPGTATTYPGAAEVCDAQFNNCEHPMRDDNATGGVYEGVVGDCFCAITTDGSGDDVCDASDCVDATGAACTPEDADADGYVDNCEIADGSSNADFTSENTYYGVEVDCYCPTTNCLSNVSGNSSSECYTPEGNTCTMPFNSTGLFLDCATNAVDTDLTVSHIFYDENGDQQAQPFEEFDNDGDRYVDCTQFDLDTYQEAGGSLLVLGGSDCDDSDELVYPAAVEYCDGQYNDCDALTYNASLAPTDETDNDLDGYVECELTIGVDWDNPDTEPTGYGDCDDTDNVVYPTAPELCDGIYNNCTDPAYDASSAPVTELDSDLDGYVECAGSTAVWKGDAITGYEDCAPSSGVTYPGAAEICDAQFNDCEHPMRDDSANGGAYEGAVGDCFCAITTDGSGDDVCDASDCVDATGAACTPEDADSDGYVDNCEIADSSTSSNDFTNLNNSNTYYGVEVDCYCPTSDCQTSVSGNSDTECYTPDGASCEMSYDASGLFEGCATDASGVDLLVNHIFMDGNGDQQDQPFEEYDNDGDRYVECTQFDLDTYRNSGGSLLVLGGSDCDDFDVRVHPTAEELCDGQYNDCENLSYTDSGAPGDETDDDGDGFIECEWDSANVPWLGAAEPSSGIDCNDADGTVYPLALELCDGQHNNCSAATYLTTTAPSNEIDDDEDGFVECGYLGLNVWAGETFPEFGYDCDDDSATRYPGADEICDGLYNDCDSLNLAWLVDPTVLDDPPADEADDDGDDYIECDYGSVTWEGVATNIIGGLDCDDADGAVFPTAPEECDGQINDCENAYTPTGVPLDELDDDGDGWVECNRSATVVWNSAIGAAEPNQVLANVDPNTNTNACFCNYVQGALVCAQEDGSDCFLSINDVEDYTYYGNSDCDDADPLVAPVIAMHEYEENGNNIGVTSCMQDYDNDGFGSSIPINPAVTEGNDCDDLNLLIHPEQDEFCEAGDQVDTDCNGDVNTAEIPWQLDPSNATFLYVDGDGDGFGDINTEATPACVVSDGFVFNQTDCNDSDPSINPIQPEICDSIDQDCDNQIDEVGSLADPSISRCTNMYRDVDQDLYGDIDMELCLCDTIDLPENPAGVEEYDGDQYVIYSGDCYDFSPNIHPLSCADNIDNDEDGLVDGEDPDCIAGLEENVPEEGEREEEEDFELLDGHDNNCDGMIAAIELDCDDDGSFPLVPNEGLGFDRADTFQMAYDIGLEVCDGLDMEISCWGGTQRLVCDKLTAEIIDGEMSYRGTGLWMLPVNESEDGYAGRYDSGHREYPNGAICGSAKGDCDDQCADRCPGQSEDCDGIDNDCEGALAGTDGGEDDELYGIPDAMVADVLIAGKVSEAEIDIDGDGYLACEDFVSSPNNQFHYSDKSCGESISLADDNDCNNFCTLTNPNAEEHCDGFLGVCGGEELDGTDADGDDGLTCGSWSAGDTTTEDIFVVVWLKDVDWAAQGSEPQEMYRPNVPDTNVDIPDQPSDTAGDSGFEADTGDTGYSMQQSDREFRTQRRQDYFAQLRPTIDAGNGFIDGDIEAELLEDMIPLVAPRSLAPHCDSYLETQMTLLLGNERMDDIREASSNAEASRIMLEACDSDFSAGCGVVRLVLTETIDDDTYAYLDEQIGQPAAFSEECLDRPEEWISRTMWQRERILEARKTIVEWECKRMFGKDCSDIETSTPLQLDWETSMISAERWLDVDRVWYKEIGRYYPEALDDGTLMSCWGDPTSDNVQLKKDVGGDCNDESNEAHRDKPEGPGDLVGLYLYGDLEDCSTCLDGIDNNCDGAIDCADPTCAPCFVGQGVGCGGGSESPCSQGGCSTPDQSSQERMYRSFALIMMALIVSLLRRREND